MSARDGLWVPPPDGEPEWLKRATVEERITVRTILESDEPPMTNAPNGQLLATALVKARSEIAAIAKDAVNPHFKSRYASLDTIIETVMPILNGHGLTVVQGVVVPDTDAAGKLVAFTLRTTLLHVSGESLSSDVVMPVAKSDPQGAGGALTYGRRYGLSALLALATDEDDDGNTASRGKATTARTERRPANVNNNAGPLMPVGKHKGQRLDALDELTLLGARAWMTENNPTRWAKDVEAIDGVLEERRVTAEAQG